MKKTVFPVTLFVAFLSVIVFWPSSAAWAEGDFSSFTHLVKSGDTVWQLSKDYGVSMEDILKANNLDGKGLLKIGMKLVVPIDKKSTTPKIQLENDNEVTHTVVQGDTVWGISQRYKVPVEKIVAANNLNNASIIHPGQKLFIPGFAAGQEKGMPSRSGVSNGDREIAVGQMPVDTQETTSADKQTQEGAVKELAIHEDEGNVDSHQTEEKQNTTASEIEASSDNQKLTSEEAAKAEGKIIALDWWKHAQYAFPIDDVALVTDFRSGKQFKLKRTYGHNHADVEPLTKEDAKIIQEIWGGWSWTRRPVIVEVNGWKIAASLAAMPHAGVDGAAANKWVKGRSGGYGSGTNLDAVKGNGVSGVIDLHFLNSRTHGTNRVDPSHQKCITEIIDSI